MTPDEIKQFRARLKLTIPQFATLLGVPLDSVVNWERGRRGPTAAAATLLLLRRSYAATMGLLLAPVPEERQKHAHRLIAVD